MFIYIRFTKIACVSNERLERRLSANKDKSKYSNNNLSCEDILMVEQSVVVGCPSLPPSIPLDGALDDGFCEANISHDIPYPDDVDRQSLCSAISCTWGNRRPCKSHRMPSGPSTLDQARRKQIAPIQSKMAQLLHSPRAFFLALSHASRAMNRCLF